jgi:phosphatidylglycerophosphatase A
VPSPLNMRAVILFLATGAYSGYAPVAPGTAGSLAALPLALLFAHLWSIAPLLQVGLLAVAVGGACWIAGRADRYLGGHDSDCVVIDEMIGLLTATALLDLTLSRLLVAFFLFRLFDILKPPPARYFDERVPGGAGVVLDDVCAGLYTNLIVRVLV